MKVLFLSIALVAMGSVFAEETYQEVFQQGIQTIRQMKYAEAKALFERALDLAETPRQQAQAVLQISLATPPEEYDKSLEMLLQFQEDAGNLPRRDAEALKLRIGVLQAALKRYDDAQQTLIAVLEAGVMGGRDKALAYNKLTDAIMKNPKRDLPLAEKWLEKWIESGDLTPADFALANTRLCGVLGAQGKFDKAYECGEKIVKRDDVSPRHKTLAYQQLACVAFYNQKMPQKAFEYAQKGMSIQNGGFEKPLYEKIRRAAEKK